MARPTFYCAGVRQSLFLRKPSPAAISALASTGTLSAAQTHPRWRWRDQSSAPRDAAKQPSHHLARPRRPTTHSTNQKPTTHRLEGVRSVWQSVSASLGRLANVAAIIASISVHARARRADFARADVRQEGLCRVVVDSSLGRTEATARKTFAFHPSRTRLCKFPSGCALLALCVVVGRAGSRSTILANGCAFFVR